MPFPALFGTELKNLDNKNTEKNCFIVGFQISLYMTSWGKNRFQISIPVELLVMEKLTRFNQDIYDLIYF